MAWGLCIATKGGLDSSQPRPALLSWTHVFTVLTSGTLAFGFEKARQLVANLTIFNCCVYDRVGTVLLFSN